MGKPYLNVLSECARQAVHVLDRFHIMQRMNKALDEVRAEEARRLKENGKLSHEGGLPAFLGLLVTELGGKVST